MEKKKFMIFIMGTGEGMNSMPEDERNAHMTKWWEWDGELEKKRVKILGEALVAEGSMMITGKDMSVSEGLVAGSMPEHVVGGYYLIEAEDMEEAVEIAKGCPTFELDGTVEVREVMEMEQDKGSE